MTEDATTVATIVRSVRGLLDAKATAEEPTIDRTPDDRVVVDWGGFLFALAGDVVLGVPVGADRGWFTVPVGGGRPELLLDEDDEPCQN